MMAQKHRVKPFRVAVVGLPTSSSNCNSGAGKSCLCNRFTRRGEGNYSSNHTSVLSHEDFTGWFFVRTNVVYRVESGSHLLTYGPESLEYFLYTLTTYSEAQCSN